MTGILDSEARDLLGEDDKMTPEYLESYMPEVPWESLHNG
jgi:hypothetical protein